MISIDDHEINHGLPNGKMRVGVVIPCYRVKNHIQGVLATIPDFVDRIYVVDDACPEQTGAFVKNSSKDPRVYVISHEKNQGVGGAVISGYKQAKDGGMDIIVKLDGDGQMDASHILSLIRPILSGKADYTKGNRFYNLETLKSMPTVRIFGNAVLSFMNKLSTGYWDIFDPTNGFTAIHRNLITLIPWHKVSNRYFFESDVLFRLNTFRSVVVDVPMPAQYGDENSNMKISRVVFEFLYKHKRNMFKRIFYNYFLRDFSVASLNLVLGVLFLIGGITFGVYAWYRSASTGIPQTAGTVMLAAMPIILGIQLLLSFLSHDVSSVPKTSVSTTPHATY
jgi:dolichol-phosphate mannosyltransferase